MKIEKYKYMSNDRYKVTISNKQYLIYEDIIIKHNLLSKENITEKELEKYLKDNNQYEAYYKSVKYINTKLRTEKEIKKYLKKANYENYEIEDTIKKLKKDGYLNDEIYVKAYIYDQINLKVVGPNKIKKDLLNQNIKEELIEKALETYKKEDQLEKIEKLINKDIRLNTNKSSVMLKNKILSNLIEKGFYKEDIITIINEIDIDDKNIYNKEYQKVYNKLKDKYEGTNLEYKIKEKMYQKGFRQ